MVKKVRRHKKKGLSDDNEKTSELVFLFLLFGITHF